MLHEFVMHVRQKEIEEKMEKLNIAGIYNLTYDQPIQVEKMKNGFSYKQLKEPLVELKIYGDEEEEAGLPESYLAIISEVFVIAEEEIPYRTMENQWKINVDLD